MLLPDINVWLGLAFNAHQHHPKAKAWFDGLLQGSICHFCRMTQQGFLRLSTNPKMNPTQTQTMNQAWLVYDRIIGDPQIVYASEPVGLDILWRQITQLTTFSHKVWNDAYLAAFAVAGGYELVTFDNGFTQYRAAGLKCTILT